MILVLLNGKPYSIQELQILAANSMSDGRLGSTTTVKEIIECDHFALLTNLVIHALKSSTIHCVLDFYLQIHLFNSSS